MSYICDALVLAIIIITVIAGIRKGLIKSLADFLGGIVSAIVSSYVGAILAKILFDVFVKQGLSERISATLSKYDTGTAISDILGSMPDFFVDLLAERGVTSQSIVTNAVGTKEEITNIITESITPVFIMIIQFFIVVILFVFCLILIRAVAALLTKIIDIPVLGQLNSLLGAGFGFFFAIILSWFVLHTIIFGVGIFDKELNTFLVDACQSSFVAKIIYQFNPFAYIA